MWRGGSALRPARRPPAAEQMSGGYPRIANAARAKTKSRSFLSCRRRRRRRTASGRGICILHLLDDSTASLPLSFYRSAEVVEPFLPFVGFFSSYLIGVRSRSSGGRQWRHELRAHFQAMQLLLPTPMQSMAGRARRFAPVDSPLFCRRND